MSRADRVLTWALSEGSTVGLALFRMVAGLMAIRHLMGFARDYAADGFYANTFYEPYGPFIPQPSEAVYVLVLAVGILSAAFLMVGFKTRWAAVTCCLMVVYHLSLNQIWYRHNRYFLALVLILLCLAPCGRALSIDALRSRLAPIGPRWSTFLIKAQMTLIYLASATSKSLSPEWRSGDVLIGRHLDDLWEGTMPDFILQIIPGDLGVRLMTIQALSTEYILALFIWFPRTRRFAFWWGIIFHGFIEVEYSVLTFSYLTLGTYFLFADLRCGEKVWVYSEYSAIQRLIARLIPWFDWLFQVRLATHNGNGVRFVARDGAVYQGWLAWIMLAANLPIPFMVFYPLSWLRFLPWGRSREALRWSPVESPRISVNWMAACMALYLVFIAATNFYRPWRILADSVRFWDLPWFFVLMCLMAAAYHRVMVWKAAPVEVSVPAPTEPATVPANALPALS